MVCVSLNDDFEVVCASCDDSKGIVRANWHRKVLRAMLDERWSEFERERLLRDVWHILGLSRTLVPQFCGTPPYFCCDDVCKLP
jgi:hypothetical protein